MSETGIARYYIDKHHLREQYSDDRKLQIRIDTHNLYSTNPGSWPDWLLGQVQLRGNERVLDAGTGSGAILLPLARKITPTGGHVTAFDMSAGIIANARRTVEAENLNVTYVLGDVQQLPFPDASFDLVMENHMLYHVPDIAAAVREAYRVLKPGGVYLAATNSATNMRELAHLHSEGIRSAAMPEFMQAALEAAAYDRQSASRFTLENGMQYIAPAFGAENVTLQTRSDSLRFTEAEPLLRYYASGPIYHGSEGAHDARVTPEQWQALYDNVAEQIRRIIAEKGFCEIGKLSGAFVAVKDRG